MALKSSNSPKSMVKDSTKLEDDYIVQEEDRYTIHRDNIGNGDQSRIKVLIVHGFDGLDEITLSDNTYICELKNGKIEKKIALLRLISFLKKN